MRELHHGIEPPRPCGYLPLQAAALEERVLADVTPREAGEMLVRGWRRFGPVYFRPACTACSECVSLRIPVQQFAPSTSQRRARRRCEGFRLTWGPPRVDDERLELLAAWHAAREEARAWKPSAVDQADYEIQLAFRNASARELAWHDGSRLVAVSLCDETPRGISAVYFYWAPELARLSPGVANVLLLVELARLARLPHVYLGYRVSGCASLAYKAAFRPHELLFGRPGMTEEPVWVPGEQPPPG